ncbi:MAG: hypothetical protein H6631_17380 [Anaerolineaceae bacterium]|nr:hypothetical protein [Anaerolineaceae bacterium]MCB9100631.1 hypothetical protein [Anaerolineales bacterium]
MKTYPSKIGAIFYSLWALLHIVGAAALLQQLAGEGATAFLATVGSATPAAEIPAVSGRVIHSVLAYYAWHLLWVGLLVLVVAIWLNWRNSRAGYWLNLAVTGAIEFGLIVTLLLPGTMALTDGGLGLALWLPAVIFSTIGVFNLPALAERRPLIADS